MIKVKTISEEEQSDKAWSELKTLLNMTNEDIKELYDKIPDWGGPKEAIKRYLDLQSLQIKEDQNANR